MMVPVATRAEDLHREAVDLVNRGRWTEAERALERARSLTQEPNLLSRIEATLAVERVHRGAVAEAEELCTRAMQRPGLTAETRALLAGQLGTVMERAGRLDEADRWLSVAIDTVEDPVARANLLMNRGVIGMQLGRLDAAAADTQTAVAAYSAAGMTVDAAEARNNLGYIDLLRGDLVSAMREMWAAHGVVVSVSPVVAAVLDVDRAEVLRDAGVTREAEELLAKAARVFGSHRMPRARGEAEFNLARSLITHDPVRAARVAAESARRFEGIRNDVWTARARAVRLRARLLAAAEDSPRGRARRLPARAEVEAVVATLQGFTLRNEAAALQITDALARLRRGRPAPRSIALPRHASLEVRLLSQELRAARAAADRRHTQARRHAGQGLDILTAWQGEFGSLDLQASAAMHGNGLMREGLTAAVESGDPRVVFEWSERARHLSQQVVPVRPPPDAELVETLAELRRLRSDDPAWLDSPRAAVLRERARERQWSALRPGHSRERLTLDLLVDALHADTAVISFVYSGRRLDAVVSTATGAQIVQVGDWEPIRAVLGGLRADLEMSAAVRTGPMASAIRSSLADRLDILSRLLTERPLAAAGDRSRVVLTVPGVLAGVPWTMLPALRGRAVTVAVSATLWQAARSRTGEAPRRAGFAVGPGVPRGEEEVEMAAAAWAAPIIRRGEDATVGAVTRLAHEVDVLHVASHGRHAGQNPMFSGLELADGALFGYDVDLIESTPATVVLSSCEGGRSSIHWGEEAIGMTRVWLHAGSRCVISAPVIVADDAACELLGAVHSELAKGIPPAVALARAAEQTGVIAPFQAHGAGF
jgi:tetratricopeptide (TPR) repeat protein